MKRLSRAIMQMPLGGEMTCGPRHPGAWAMASISPCTPDAPQAMDKLQSGEYDAVGMHSCAPPGRTVPGPIHHATVYRRESHGRAPSQHLRVRGDCQGEDGAGGV